MPGAQAGDCLDAEILAAWAEGLLDAPQRATAEAHASKCARCQAMLAVMSRTTPAAAASTGSPIRKWLMMLGPPMAAAAAVALWFAVGQAPPTTVIDTLSKQQAKAEVEPAPSLAMPPQASVSGEADRKVASPSSEAFQRRERADSQTLSDARKEREARPDFATTAAPPPATVGNEKKDLAAAKRVDAATGSDRIGAAVPAPVASPPPPPPPPASPRPAESALPVAGNRPAPAPAPVVAGAVQQANQAQNQAPTQNQAPNQNQVQTTAQGPPVQRQQQALEERVIVADKPAARAAEDSAAANRAGGRGGAAGGFADANALSFRAKAGDFELAAPQSSIRWRVVEGRTVQRSPDAGTTWSNHYTAPSGVFLTAGTAPSATICWLVGRAGAIVVSTDGVWQRVTFPDAVDLASVVAPDARTATVTTVDGRRFATADGGRTWTRQ